MNEIAKFGFGIKLYQFQEGNIKSEIRTLDKNMPPEIIIMQLKKYLTELENNYLSA